MSLGFVDLPLEIRQHVIDLLTDQHDLVSLCSVSKLYYRLAAQALYRKIYLNDTRIETSTQWALAPTWTYLPLPMSSNNDSEHTSANAVFNLLVRSFEENTALANNVTHIRLNWDLMVSRQVRFVKVLVENSRSLRVLENITDMELSNEVLRHEFARNITSLDLPPPYAIPLPEIKTGYLAWLRRILSSHLAPDFADVTNLTVFMDPVLLFNNVVKIDKKLELETFKLHCRGDMYPRSLYNHTSITRPKISDIFSTKHLKELTVISWFEELAPQVQHIKFKEWYEFKNLQDITLISIQYDDKAIGGLLESCTAIKRLKMDFVSPGKKIPTDSLIYRAIMKHNGSLEFLDARLATNHRIVNLNFSNLKIVIKIDCPCEICDSAKAIFREKIMPSETDYDVSNRNWERLEVINYFGLFAVASLTPYARAVDRYPSVRTGADSITSFLHKFNLLNIKRAHFIPLVEDDFYTLYGCLIHSMKSDLQTFVEFPKLRFLVLNEIPFVIKTMENVGKAPIPLFYDRGFRTNFDLHFDVDIDRI